jgi:hypothetical protein
MDIVEQMLAAQTMIKQTVAELQSAGLHDATIASCLLTEAGALWRDTFPNEADRRKVITHGAEVAITGRSQPIP